MKHRIKKFLLNAPGFEALCRTLTPGHVRAIMYHTFSEDGNGSSISRATLQQQLALISTHHTAITPADHLAALNGQSAVRCPVVVTVDDGYADFYDIAFPVLSAAGIPAMLFVTTGFVAGDTWFWWDKLAFIIDNGNRANAAVTIGTQSLSLDLATSSGRRAAWHQIADRCRFLPDADKDKAIEALAEAVGTSLPALPPAEMRGVTWDQVRTMAKQGVGFGAHTVNHPILSRIELHCVRSEVLASQSRLETELGEPVRWFCYPQGGPADVTPEILDIVRENFDGSYLAYQEMQAPSDRAAMPRYVASSDMLEFRWMMCGAEYLFLRLKNLLGRPTGVGAEYWQGSECLENP